MLVSNEQVYPQHELHRWNSLAQQKVVPSVGRTDFANVRWRARTGKVEETKDLARFLMGRHARHAGDERKEFPGSSTISVSGQPHFLLGIPRVKRKLAAAVVYAFNDRTKCRC